MGDGPARIGGGRPSAPETVTEAAAKPGGGSTITVPNRWGDSHLDVTVYPVKTQKPHKVAVSELAAKLLKTQRSNTPGTEEYYAKQGFVRIETQDGAAYLSPADFDKAVDHGVKWSVINIADNIELAKMEEAAREQQEAGQVARQAAKTLRKKGLHGSQKAGQGLRDLEQFKRDLDYALEPLKTITKPKTKLFKD